MTVKVNFQNGSCRHLGFFRNWNFKSAHVVVFLYLPPHQIWWRAVELWRFLCFQNGGRLPSWIFVEVKFGGISVSGTSVLVSESNFVQICAIATELWPFKWISKMADAAILDFLEVKFDVTGSNGRPVSTSTPNLVMIAQRAAELWRFMCFRPPSWIFAKVKFGAIYVSGTSVLVSEPNFVRICAIATELWPFKWIFKMAAAAILDLSEVKFDVNGSRGLPVSTSRPIWWRYLKRRPSYGSLCVF